MRREVVLLGIETQVGCPGLDGFMELDQFIATLAHAEPYYPNVLRRGKGTNSLHGGLEWVDAGFLDSISESFLQRFEAVGRDISEKLHRYVGLRRIRQIEPRSWLEIVLNVLDSRGELIWEIHTDEQPHGGMYEPQGLIPVIANISYMTDPDDEAGEFDDAEPGDQPDVEELAGQKRHGFSEGQGFEDPYEAFDFDPTELRIDLDPDQIDPADSHALADLLDESAIPDEEVDAEELLDVGLSYMDINRFEEATETFERAARFADDDLIEQEAWTNKGTAHAELEEWDPAIGAFREAIHIDEESEHAATAHTNLAHALWEFGKTEAPLEHAERAVEIDERFAEGWYNRAFFLNERGLAEQALDSIENAIRLGYRNADVLEEKSRALEALGEYETAAEIEEEAEELREQAEEELLQ